MMGKSLEFRVVKVRSPVYMMHRHTPEIIVPRLSNLGKRAVPDFPYRRIGRAVGSLGLLKWGGLCIDIAHRLPTYL